MYVKIVMKMMKIDYILIVLMALCVMGFILALYIPLPQLETQNKINACACCYNHPCTHTFYDNNTNTCKFNNQDEFNATNTSSCQMMVKI